MWAVSSPQIQYLASDNETSEADEAAICGKQSKAI